MEERYHFILIIAGIVAVVYILFRYIIPLLLKLFGIIVSFVAYTIAVGIAIAVVILIIGYVVRIYKSHNL